MRRTVLALILVAGLAPATQGASKPLMIPSAAKKMLNPVPPSEESIENGLLLYSSQCAMCHGKSGAGDGDMAPKLGVQVPDLTDPARMKARTDGELYYELSEGHEKMPGNKERLREESRWNIVNALRTMVRGGL